MSLKTERIYSARSANLCRDVFPSTKLPSAHVFACPCFQTITIQKSPFPQVHFTAELTAVRLQSPSFQPLIRMKVPCTYPGCTKQFASLPNCRRHVKTCHLGIKRHECEFCFARFSSRQNLTLHMYRHQRQTMQVPADALVEGNVEAIPRLTTMVELTKDPGLRPFSKVIRIYPYSITQERTKLPKISKRRQTQAASLLPSPNSR